MFCSLCGHGHKLAVLLHTIVNETPCVLVTQTAIISSQAGPKRTGNARRTRVAGWRSRKLARRCSSLARIEQDPAPLFDFVSNAVRHKSQETNKREQKRTSLGQKFLASTRLQEDFQRRSNRASRLAMVQDGLPQSSVDLVAEPVVVCPDRIRHE